MRRVYRFYYNNLIVIRRGKTLVCICVMLYRYTEKVSGECVWRGEINSRDFNAPALNDRT